MNDYWQIISLINEILTIYECETFKIDHIKAEREREDHYDIYREEYVDSVSMYFPDDNKPEDYKRQYLPDLFICIDKNAIDIRVDRYVGAKNPDERMKGWRIELKFIEDNLSEVYIKCIYPKNNIDFLGFKEAFNTEARKRISEIEKIIWGYSLHRLYNVDVSTQITESNDKDDEVKEYAEMHIEIYATAKDYKSINLSDEDIEAIKEHLERVNNCEPSVDIDPHFGVNIDPHIDPRTGGIIDPMVKDPIVVKLPSGVRISTENVDIDKLTRQYANMQFRTNGTLPHTDVNHSNDDPLPEEETEKEEESGMLKSDWDIIKNIYVADIDTHWLGLMELYSQPQYSGFVKSDTLIECVTYFEDPFMTGKYFKEKVIYELNKEENIIHYTGYFGDDTEDAKDPDWYIDCEFDENDELESVGSTAYRVTTAVGDVEYITHNVHVQALIKELSKQRLRKGVKYHE